MARLPASTQTQAMEPGDGTEQLSRALPREVLRLLAEHVHSIGELDLLMLLEDDRMRSWDVDEICDRLRCPRSWVEPRLDEALNAIAHAHRTRLEQLTAVIVSPRRRRRALAAVRGRRH